MRSFLVPLHRQFGMLYFLIFIVFGAADAQVVTIDMLAARDNQSNLKLSDIASEIANITRASDEADNPVIMIVSLK